MKKIMTIITVCLATFCPFLHLLSLEKEKPKRSIVLRGRYTGLFSCFDDVLSLCKSYEQGIYSGITVDFAKRGYYYEKSYGLNWWNYYCKPICCGVKKKQKIIEGHDPWEIELRTSREEAWELIQKYIVIKEDILEEVDQFCRNYFQGDLVIGVHYRGTDKCTEAPRISYEMMVEQILDKIEKYDLEKCKIFLATDEEGFLDYMLSIFGNRLCFKEETIRSTDQKPTHYNQLHPYQSGKDAIIDALILSRCDILIRTSSNLSRWSTYFNPGLPVYEVSQRYDVMIP